MTAENGLPTTGALRQQVAALREQGRHAEAIQVLEQLISQVGENPEDLFAGAFSLAHLGRLEDAAYAYGRVVALAPQHPEAHLRLAELLADLGHPEAAAKSYQNAIHLRPTWGLALREFGIFLHRNGKMEVAQEILERAAEAEPDRWESYLSLGGLYHVRRQYEQANHCYQHGLALAPDNLRLLDNAALLAQADVRYADALRLLDRAIELNPEASKPYRIRAGVLTRLHRHREAIENFQMALRCDPNDLKLFSKMLMVYHYMDSFTPQELYEEHLRFGELVSRTMPPPRSSWPNLREETRRLRIGYLSPDFRHHSVAFFFLSLLSHHDRSQFEIFCYGSVENPDPVTETIQRHCDHWRNILPIPDTQVAQVIGEDQIDILIDLAGHSGETRLPVFALKPAPVQASWLGYPDTTGLPTMDYRLSDAVADPVGAGDDLCCETLVRLPSGFLCYSPPVDAPAVVALPADPGASLTFGSFNNVDKVSETCLELWGAVLKAVPDSRLILKGESLKDRDVVEYCLSCLQCEGIERERVRLVPFLPSQEDHMNLYGEVDIALDAFPYHGTTTTLEALYMGVPVVSLAGNHHAARVGCSIVTHLGRSEWVAASKEEYVRIAS
ncbi:MAG: O-linked N-acetylglucosamine transferase family protein, partial [Planctomycetota bacterium]